MDWSGLRFAVSHVLAIGLGLGGTSPAQAQLRPEPDAIKLAPRELIDRLRASSTDYFRFVESARIARVCEVFAEEIPNVPSVRLHGDAHIEQFAVTEDARGLDDFDDSARGPVLIDMVRFLGSVDLALRRRDWTRSREALFDRFFAQSTDSILELAHADCLKFLVFGLITFINRLSIQGNFVS